MKFALRPVTDDDHPWLVELHNDPLVLRNLTDPSPITLEHHLNWWRGLDRIRNERWIFTVDGRAAGFCKFYSIDRVNQNCVLGADLQSEFRGRGLAREMWVLMIERAFNTLGLFRVGLTTAEFNVPAQRVYERLGFINEGRLTSSLARDGRHWDQFVYFLTREAWRVSSDERREQSRRIEARPSNKKTRVVFLGSRPLGKAALQFLLEQSDVEVVGKVSLPNLDGCYWSEDPSELTNVPELSEQRLAEVEFDLGISVNYWRVIKEPLLSRPPLGFINLHHAYNLRLRGRNTHTFAILNARRDNIWHHGATLHYMGAQVDAGQIIASVATPITEFDTAQSLMDRVNRDSLILFKQWMGRCWRERVTPYDPPQGYSTYRGKDLISKEMPMELSPLELYDRVRSLTFPPYERPYVWREGKKRYLSVAPSPQNEIYLEIDTMRAVYIDR